MATETKTKKEVKPAARLVRLAELVTGGMDMRAALAAAGFGPGCIEGLAPVMGDVLRKNGLLGSKRGAAPKAAAADTKEVTA